MVQRFVVVHTTVSDHEHTQSRLNIGDNVKEIGVGQWPPEYQKSYEQAPMNIKKQLREMFNKVFRKYESQSGVIDTLIPQDIIPAQNLSTQRNKVISQNPYLLKSDFIDWIKNNTKETDYFKLQDSIVVGTEKLKHPRKLFHYTTFSAFEKIINSGKWLMSHYAFQDDKEEIVYTQKLLKELWNELNGPSDLFDKLISFLKEKLAQTYLLSLTVDENSNEMWKEYAKNDGVCFEFNEFELNCLINDNLHTDYQGNPVGVYDMPSETKFMVTTLDHVLYGRQEQLDILRPLVNDFIRLNMDLCLKTVPNQKYISINKDMCTIATIFSIVSLFFKNQEWNKQQEVRFSALQTFNVFPYFSPQGFHPTKQYGLVPDVSFSLTEHRSPITAIHIKKGIPSIKNKVKRSLKKWSSFNINIVEDG